MGFRRFQRLPERTSAAERNRLLRLLPNYFASSLPPPLLFARLVRFRWALSCSACLTSASTENSKFNVCDSLLNTPVPHVFSTSFRSFATVKTEHSLLVSRLVLRSKRSSPEDTSLHSFYFPELRLYKIVYSSQQIHLRLSRSEDIRMALSYSTKATLWGGYP